MPDVEEPEELHDRKVCTHLLPEKRNQEGSRVRKPPKDPNRINSVYLDRQPIQGALFRRIQFREF